MIDVFFFELDIVRIVVRMQNYADEPVLQKKKKKLC